MTGPTLSPVGNVFRSSDLSGFWGHAGWLPPGAACPRGWSTCQAQMATDSFPTPGQVVLTEEPAPAMLKASSVSVTREMNQQRMEPEREQ